MHYYIDGYNLLFRAINSDEILQKKREKIIHLIHKYLLPLHVSATLVFDGCHREDEDTDFYYYDSLKIVFTSSGQTADEYIIENIAYKKNASNETIVTSDRALAQFCKNLGSHTRSITNFLEWICEKKRKSNSKKTKKLSQTNFEDSQKNIDRLLKIFEKNLEKPNNKFQIDQNDIEDFYK